MPLLLITEKLLKQEDIPVNIFVSVLFWKGLKSNSKLLLDAGVYVSDSNIKG